jgi:hypothetical protein
MTDSKNLFFSSKFQGARERISSKFIDNFGTGPRKISPALDYCTLIYRPSAIYRHKPRRTNGGVISRFERVYFKPNIYFP